MLLNPHVGAETFYLLPETVQVLLLWMRMVGFKNTECVVVNLFPSCLEAGAGIQQIPRDSLLDRT